MFEAVELIPYKILLDLNEELNLSGLNLNGKLMLSNLKSLKAFYNPFKQIKHLKFNLAIFNSYFKFVPSSYSLDEHARYLSVPIKFERDFIDSCVYESRLMESWDFVFSGLDLNEFTLCNIYFEKEMCPMLFKDTTIKSFIVIDPNGAFGFGQLKSLTNEPQFNARAINANIRQIDLTYQALEERLWNSIDGPPQWIDAEYILNADLFKQTNRVNINKASNLLYIQEKTFFHLDSVKKLELNDINFKRVITRSRRFLKYLNGNQPVVDLDHQELTQSMVENVFQLVIWIRDGLYFNGEHDICLFKNFPHNKLVFPFLLYTNESFPCTCTVYWLYKYVNKYQSIYNLNQDVVPYHCFKNAKWDKCDFQGLFNEYCGGAEFPDPAEPFTTLVPSMGTTTRVPDTTTVELSTSSGVITWPTMSWYTYPTEPSSTATEPTTTSTTTKSATLSNNNQHLTTDKSSTNEPFVATTVDHYKSQANSRSSTNQSNLIIFYMILVLSIVAALSIAILIVLFYRILRSDCCNPTTVVGDNELRPVDFDTLYGGSSLKLEDFYGTSGTRNNKIYELSYLEEINVQYI